MDLHHAAAGPRSSHPLGPSGARGLAVRWELVQRIRREIAAGTYATPERWEAAVTRLLRRLEA